MTYSNRQPAQGALAYLSRRAGRVGRGKGRKPQPLTRSVSAAGVSNRRSTPMPVSVPLQFSPATELEESPLKQTPRAFRWHLQPPWQPNER